MTNTEVQSAPEEPAERVTPMPAAPPRRFWLRRHTDPSGVSGTGYIAQGSLWTSGAVALHWPGDPVTSTIVYDSLADLVHCHGHNGETVVEWIDEPPSYALPGPDHW